MRIADNRADVAVGGALETSRATIRASSKVFGFFANQTYSNKEQAILREYVANGMDAHALNGETRPVEVSLPDPNDVSPALVFRDYGPGMSHEFMMGPFMAYADGTTKNADDTQIGGFGIGSKSGLAYTDSFSLTVYFEGTVRVYVMYQDEDGCPSLSLLSSRDMRPGEETGVEIQIPVKPTDCEAFQLAVQPALGYFEPTPLIKNLTTPLMPVDYIAEGRNWGMRREAGPLHVIMGGVCYPVQPAVKQRLDTNSIAHKLIDFGLDVRVPIGTCAPSLSREALSLDNETVAAVQRLLEDVQLEVAERLSVAFEAFETRWESAAELGRQIGNGYTTRSRFLADNAQWRGERLSPTISPAGGSYWFIQPKSNWKGHRTDKPNFESCYTLSPSKIQQVLVDDLPLDWVPAKRRIAARVTAWVADNCTPEQRQHLAILVVRDVDLSRLGDPPVINLSTVTPVALSTKTGRTKGDTVTVYKANSRFVPYGLSGGTLGSWMRDAVAAPDTGVYVPMNCFRLPEKLRHWFDLTGITWSSVHFVNKGEIPKLEGWTSLEDIFLRKVSTELETRPDLPRLMWLREQGLLADFQPWRNFRAPEGSPLAKIIALATERHLLGTSADKYVGYIEPQAPEGPTVPELIAQLSPETMRLLSVLKTRDEVDFKILNWSL